MAYPAIDDPEAYFQVKTYTGDGSTPSITLDGDTDMQPDMVWIKNRDATDSHCLFDSVRTATEVLHGETSAVEATDADTLTSFDSDGFALGADVKVNTDTEAYVAWCWKAGTSFSNDASATSIGSIDSSGSVSTDAGFSIVIWTETTANSQTIAHGLGTTPAMIITKLRDDSAMDPAWYTFHQSLGTGERIMLDSNSGDITSGFFNGTLDSSVFHVGYGDSYDNKSAVAYCFADVQGYSKFGSYTGNGNADGTFVYTGFRPAWVMVKATSISGKSWMMFDNKRIGYNQENYTMVANESDAEDTTAGRYDILSNGFKLRNSGSAQNGSGTTYIYAAFAEAPFVNSNGVPCNAR